MKEGERIVYVGERSRQGRLFTIHFNTKTYELKKECVETGMIYIASMAVEEGYLYTSSLDQEGRNLFCSYRIQKSGRISKINEWTDFGNDATHITADRKRGILIASDFLACTLMLYRLGDAGDIRCRVDAKRIDEEGSHVGPRQDAFHPHCTVIHKKERIALTADLGCDKIRLFGLDGRLRQLGEINLEKGAGIRHIVIHPRKNYVYAISEISSDIFVCMVDYQSFTLTLKQSFSNLQEKAVGESIGGDIVMSEDGAFLLASNRGENTIVLYRVMEDGLLKKVDFARSRGWVRKIMMDQKTGCVVAGIEAYLDVGAYGFSEKQEKKGEGIQIFHLNREQEKLVDLNVGIDVPGAYAFSIL